ncbi:hypothetical protein OG897_35750 [Streptomyces sp. NBC_00237]|uniref:hypothetical protein n=1 Tax=Streptomyces sp. NBC_00237 TaxID=2975687 RepID=UPI00225157A8|nr:hypothetical protein [Streptomyces sp. NBC_00237]MCX5206747.1 hypothetical protein [Streptomyces sp. NBC_00237]
MFAQAGGVWNVNNTNAVLRNTVTDADGNKSNLSFEVFTTDAQGNAKDRVKLTDANSYGILVSPFVDSGKVAEVTVPYGKLKPGVTYTFHTSGYNGSLYETTWSPWAKFRIRNRAVDITLPEPDKNAPSVNLESYQEPQEAKRSVPASAGASARGGANENCADVDSNTVDCVEVGEPGSLTAEQLSAVKNRLGGVRADADLVKWCSGSSVGYDWIKRTEACLLKAQPIKAIRYDTVNGQRVLVGTATFASVIQIKLDPQSTSFLQEWTVSPISFVAGPGGAAGWGPVTLSPVFSCAPQCSTSSPTWRGFPTWDAKGSDLHVATAVISNTASGTSSSNITNVTMTWKYKATMGDAGAVHVEGDMGTSAPDVNVRCDKVLDPVKPGCVFDEYRPTWVMNFKKTPAAIAHAWLIQSKLPTHPGSKKSGKPMFFLPKTNNLHNRDPQKNRDVICPTGWAAKYGNPNTTALPDFAEKDVASCDEFAYAASYNSGGMPKALGGLNEVSSGNQCAQTYATRVKAGEWHLYDEERQAAPTWTEVCGRSSMSSWINTTSMAGFSGTFSAAGKYHLLDSDEYWVRFPEMEHCDASKATVTCTVPKV